MDIIQMILHIVPRIFMQAGEVEPLYPRTLDQTNLLQLIKIGKFICQKELVYGTDRLKVEN
jgi:hypothetical protein